MLDIEARPLDIERVTVLDAQPPPIAPLDERTRRTHPQGYGWGYPDPGPPPRPQGGPPTRGIHYGFPYFLGFVVGVWAGCWSLLTVW